MPHSSHGLSTRDRTFFILVVEKENEFEDKMSVVRTRRSPPPRCVPSARFWPFSGGEIATWFLVLF